MHIILTGEREVGKTALAWRLGHGLRMYGFSTGGFVTEKTADGLLLCNLAGGEPIILACTSRPLEEVKYTKVGGYFFFDSALRLARHMLRWPSDVVVIDEFGAWEAVGGGLASAFDAINSFEVTHSISVVRKSVLPQIISKYYREPLIIEVTQGNQEQVYQAILDRFQLFSGATPISGLK